MKNLKKFAALLLAGTMVLGLTGCGAASAEDLAEVSSAVNEANDALAAAAGDASSKRVFKHGFDLDYPPYSYINDDGTMGGFDVELCQAVCEHLGWEYEAVPFNWDAKDAELNSKAIQTADSMLDTANNLRR